MNTLRERIAAVLATNAGLALDDEGDRERLLAALLAALDEGLAELVARASVRALAARTPFALEFANMFRAQARRSMP